MDAGQTRQQFWGSIHPQKKTFSLGSKHYFWIKKEVLTKQNTQTHTHTRAPIPRSHTDASRITQCCIYTTSLRVQAIYTTHGKRLKTWFSQKVKNLIQWLSYAGSSWSSSGRTLRHTVSPPTNLAVFPTRSSSWEY